MVLDQGAEDIAAKYLPNRLWADGSYPGVPEKMIGLMPQEMTYILAMEGVRSTWVTPCENYRTNAEQPWIYTYRNAIAQPPLTAIQRHMAQRRAIAGVPSLNFAGYRHWLYVLEGVVYDPAPPREGVRRYRQDSTLEICEAILVW